MKTSRKVTSLIVLSTLVGIASCAPAEMNSTPLPEPSTNAVETSQTATQLPSVPPAPEPTQDPNVSPTEGKLVDGQTIYRVAVEVGKYPVDEEFSGCSTLTLPRIDPFCSQKSDRALTDRDISLYMSQLAAGVRAPGSIGSTKFRLDAVHWLLQVIQAPVEKGGPELMHNEEFLQILNRWIEEDFSQINDEYDWLLPLWN